MKATICAAAIVLCALVSPSAALPQSDAKQQPPPDLIKQGQQLLHEGKLEEALALFRQDLHAWPDSLVANFAAGSALDLLGQGDEARQDFQKAINVADTPEHKASAERQMAVSYAFESNCPKAVEYEQQVFDYYGSVKNFFEQGEIADEAARICVDSGVLDAALKWYQIGHDSGLKEPDIKPARIDLWEFRWEHAQARIAARRGDAAGAQKHVESAKAILAKRTNPEQAAFLPYLLGYVAFYSGDFTTARDEFAKANQNDPFILCLSGETYEKLGDNQKAIEFYRKAAAAVVHNPPAAYAVPYARRRLAELSK